MKHKYNFKTLKKQLKSCWHTPLTNAVSRNPLAKPWLAKSFITS